MDGVVTESAPSGSKTTALDTADGLARASSYRSALKASSVTAVSSVIVLLSRLVRTKATAVLLGPAGIGLMGMFSTFLATVQTVADMGTRSSAVRQVAGAAEAGDLHATAQVAVALRWLVLALGLTGAGLVCLFAGPIGRASFGSDEYRASIFVLALAVLFSCVNNGQRVLLRGLRRIGDLARSDIWSAVWGTIVTVLLVWWGGMDGIALSLAAAGLISVAACWFYARRVALPAVALSTVELRTRVHSMLSLGVVFLVTGIMATLVQFAIRAILVRSGGLEIAGEFQAASTISFVFVGFVLQAMGQDFYPRIVGLTADHASMNRLTNEQVELSMLLVGPGLVVTALCAPHLTRLLYSSEFVHAGDLLRWLCLGVLLRVAVAPLTYILMAKGNVKAILAAEVATSALQLAAFWVLYSVAGLPGAAFALLAAYAPVFLFTLYLARRCSDFQLSRTAGLLLVLGCTGLAIVIVTAETLSAGPAFGVGIFVLAALSAYCYRQLTRMTSLPLVAHLLGRLRLRLLRARH